MITRKTLFVFILLFSLASMAGFAIYFQCTRLLIVSLRPRECGMGNQMFRYAAGLGLAERHPDFQVCWHGLDIHSTRHTNSFFLDHMDPTTALPECDLWIVIMGEVLLKHLSPPFSTYVPLIQSETPSTLVDGPMETFRYFPTTTTPLFRLKAYSAAQTWMQERNLTSAIHVRRGDYAWLKVPLAFYMRNMVHNAVVVTDDPEWIRFHTSVFGQCALSEGHDAGFDMALLAAATDTVVIGVGTFAWWGAYLSKARRVVYYGKQAGSHTLAYVEGDRMPVEWLKRF